MFAFDPGLNGDRIARSIKYSEDEAVAQSILAYLRDNEINSQSNQSSLSRQFDDIKSLIQIKSMNSSSPAPMMVQHAASIRTKNDRPGRKLALAPGRLHPAWNLIGVTGSNMLTSQDRNTDWHLEFTVMASITRLVTGHALHIVMNIRQTPSSPWSFSFLGGSRFDVCRTVRSDSDFMRACRAGDLYGVRDGLRNGEGRISDRDEKNWTPLAVCVPVAPVRHKEGMLTR